MHKEVLQKVKPSCTSDKLSWILIGIGIFLRIVRYLHNPSLWFDEAGNTLPIITQSFSEFTTPHQYGQTAPYGFHIYEKLAVIAFGNSEYALRLFPLLFGISSLFLLYKIAKHYISPNAVPIAIGLFAFSDTLVIFSSEIKPYSGDVAIALLMYASTIHLQSRKLTAFQIIFYGILGAIVLWISHSVVFIMTGIGIMLMLSCLLNKDWERIWKISFAFLIWLCSFMAVYFIYTSRLIASEVARNSVSFMIKERAYMPFPPTTLTDIQWYIDILFKIFNQPVGFILSGLAVLAFLVGCVSVYTDRKESFYILLLPLFVTLFVSSLKLYGFADRYVIFLIPFLLLFVAEGAEFIRVKTSNNSAKAGAILIFLLFLYPVTSSGYHAIKPFAREDIKPVISYIKENWRDGDFLYVYYMSYFAFEYYSKYHTGNYSFMDNDYVMGAAPRDWYFVYRRNEFKGFWDKEKPFSQPASSILNEYIEDLNKLKGRKRVWLLFSSTVPKDGINEEKFFCYYLNTIGRRIDSFGRPGLSAAYLYDLSETHINQ